MKHLSKHSEKIFLFLATGLLVVSYVLSNSLTTTKQAQSFRSMGVLRIAKSKNEVFVELNKDLSLMPGDAICYRIPPDEQWRMLEIRKASFSAGSKVEIFLEDDEITGSIRQAFSLVEDWRNSRESSLIKTAKGSQTVNHSEIVGIKGRPRLWLDEVPSDLESPDAELSFYQRTLEGSRDERIGEKIKWTNPKAELNSSSYDLFTPPIIYIHEGKLTTRMPSKEEKQQEIEPFGLELKSASKSAYPLRLVSWVGEVPYFEARADGESEEGQRIRNRIQPGACYKKSPNPKPGQPNVEVCDENDTEKWFKVEYFAVETYYNPQTGGRRPVGRAMVRDFVLNAEPFEINSLMTRVEAGDYTFRFAVSLPGLPGSEMVFKSTDEGKTYTFSGRDYEVSSVDLVNKMLTITKKDPRLSENVSQTYSF